jgi:hypothetical protein
VCLFLLTHTHAEIVSMTIHNVEMSCWRRQRQRRRRTSPRRHSERGQYLSVTSAIAAAAAAAVVVVCIALLTMVTPAIATSTPTSASTPATIEADYIEIPSSSSSSLEPVKPEVYVPPRSVPRPIFAEYRIDLVDIAWVPSDDTTGAADSDSDSDTPAETHQMKHQVLVVDVYTDAPIYWNGSIAITDLSRFFRSHRHHRQLLYGTCVCVCVCVCSSMFQCVAL